jgi:lysozyme
MTIRELLIRHEGRRNTGYKCPAGFSTIGVGWNIDANPLPPDIALYLKHNGCITDEQIDQLLDISIRNAQADCRVLFPDFDNFSYIRRMALTDFVFQLGFRRARRFVHAISAINAGNWQEAANEMKNSNWYKQTTKRADEIINMIVGENEAT